MKSIKPGRGPSMISAIAGIGAILFGIVWTVSASAMGGGFMGIFGLVFIVVAIINVIYNFKNATSENRYSAFDITDETQEPDPLNQRFGRQIPSNQPGTSGGSAFCPYCGTKVKDDFAFCHKCGKELP